MIANVGEPWIVSSVYSDKKIRAEEFPCTMFVNTEERDKELLKKLCNDIYSNNNRVNDDYKIFRLAMNTEDIVAKYMFLYQILLFKHPKVDGEESQKDVDRFIRSKYSYSKHQYQVWKDTNRKETIYTRLRNQVGHYRGKTPNETKIGMGKKIYELIDLVKMSII